MKSLSSVVSDSFHDEEWDLELDLDPEFDEFHDFPWTDEDIGEQEISGRVDRSSREYVRWIQQSLNGIMRLRLAVDGILGPMTRSAIRSFQAQHDLAVDGIVGPQTERALIAAGAGNTPGSGTSPPVVPTPSIPTTYPKTLRYNVASIAVQQWLNWGKGTIKECESRIRNVLEDYWRTAVGYLPNQTDWCAGVAWSAVFVSWVMVKAGAGSSFRYSSAHTEYVGEAKRNRIANNSNPFKAYRTTEIAPRVGDLVCKERANSGVTYDNVDKGFRSSHCDIVTKVRPGQIETIGGNLSDSVRKDTVETDASGRIKRREYYAVVRVGG